MAEEVPAEEVPAEEVPAEEVPAEEVPAEEVPAERPVSRLLIGDTWRSLPPLKRFFAWRRRPSIRQIREEQVSWLRDERHHSNDRAELKLPEGEAVNLAGLVLIEVFTPSTFTALELALQRWGARDRSRDVSDSRNDVARGRVGFGRRWSNLGSVRSQGVGVFGPVDESLPTGVQLVQLSLDQSIPSISTIAAYFTLSDEAGDLGHLLERKYQARAGNVDIRMPGWMGAMRARIPFWRPLGHQVSMTVHPPERVRAEVISAFVDAKADECAHWFYELFPGCFSRLSSEDRPLMRLYLTKKSPPFDSGQGDWQRTLGISEWDFKYDCQEYPGWYLTESSAFRGGRLMDVRFAARRQDVVNEYSNGDDSNWSLGYSFFQSHSSLIARFGEMSFLRYQVRRLAEIRDHPPASTRMLRSVQDAKILDRYLLTDGLDSRTVIGDTLVFTKSLSEFRYDVVEYGYERTRDGRRGELCPEMLGAMRSNAKRLRRDLDTIIPVLQISSEIRQSVANTLLQRWVLLVSIVALVVAGMSLMVSMSAASSPEPSGPAGVVTPSEIPSRAVLPRTGPQSSVPSPASAAR